MCVSVCALGREMDEGLTEGPKSGKQVSGNPTPRSSTNTDLLSLCLSACSAAVFFTTGMEVKATQKLVITLALFVFEHL